MSDYSQRKWAIINEPPKQAEVEKWYGVYRGVRFEINRFKPFHGMGQKYSWTYYLWLYLDEQVHETHRDKFWLKPVYSKWSENGPERLLYQYYDSVISAIEFHGGCTWYSKESTVDEKSRVVKIGCDYQHIWDQGADYTLECVTAQAHKSIDSLIEIVGEVKVRTNGDGKWRLESELT